jgi:hypothetical protein
LARTLRDVVVDQQMLAEVQPLNSFEHPAESRALLELARGHRVLEIGTFQAYSTILMSRTAKLVHSVDWHRGGHELGEQDTLSIAWRNIRQAKADNIVLMVGRSADVLPWLAGPYDLVFIDGSHEYEDVRRDINDTWLLAPKLLFHDYGGYPGVTRAVDEFTARWRLEAVPVAGSLVMVTPAFDTMRGNGP